jgi:hypothetical protein
MKRADVAFWHDPGHVLMGTGRQPKHFRPLTGLFVQAIGELGTPLRSATSRIAPIVA